MQYCIFANIFPISYCTLATAMYNRGMANNETRNEGRNTMTKKMSSSQMAWNLKKGYAWENPNNDGGLADEFITKEHVYVWTPPHLSTDGQLVEGCFESI